jgi:hypothetical protein
MKQDATYAVVDVSQSTKRVKITYDGLAPTLTTTTKLVNLSPPRHRG